MKKLFYTLVVGFMITSFSLSAGSSITAASESFISDTLALKEYTGKYKFTGLPFDYMEITLKDGVLNVEAGDQGGPMTQDKEMPEKFDVLGEAIFKFIRNEEKKVIKVVVEYQGMILNGEKEK